mgnify:CR=1 FL=1
MRPIKTALTCAALAGAVLLAGVAAAQDKPAGKTGVTVQHGLSLLETLKYPADFKHLDYVNPDAPKGGTLRRFTIGTKR